MDMAVAYGSLIARMQLQTHAVEIVTLAAT